jgi:phenylacetate-CoA ligase
VVTSEMLFEDDKTFGKTIRHSVNMNTASELDLIAFENPRRRMANELGNLYRNFDENDKVLPYGQEGRIVITLYNKAHPLLDMTLVISGFWMKKYLAKTYFKN